MKIISYYILISILFIFFSCNNNNQNKTEIDEFDTCQQISPSSKSETTVFTIPTPVQVPATLKIIDSEFSNELVNHFLNTKTVYTNKQVKALNLGICFVDLAYIALNNQNQYSYHVLSKIDYLLDELDIENQDIIASIDKLKDNMSNTDSISQIVLTSQNQLADYFQEKDEKEVGLLMICGFYIEGLNILLNTYSKLLATNELTIFKKNYLNSLLFEHDIFLDNLIELTDIYNSKCCKSINNELKMSKVHFKDLKISINFDTDNKKVNNIKLDDKRLFEIQSHIIKLREKILSGILD